ncbi:CoA ester lyase [Actinoallomurus acanthiterrae]
MSSTWLFVPGDRPERFAKATASGADQIIIDLEDGVTPDAKASARRAAAEWLAAGHAAWIRLNAPGTPWHDEDVSEMRGLTALRGMVLPKSERPSDLALLASRLPPGTGLMALIESARGIVNATAIADCGPVTRLAFGAVDYSLDIDADDTGDALLFARSTLVVASRAAGKPPPVDSVTTDLTPHAAASDARRARALGFGGKFLIHPAQVAPAAEAFRPTDDQLEWAYSVLDAASQAANGATSSGGHMIDRPVVERARRIITAQARLWRPHASGA